MSSSKGDCFSQQLPPPSQADSCPNLPKRWCWVTAQSHRRAFATPGFAIAAFAFSGVIIDFIYRGMALLFGSDTRFTTVIKKVLFDQYVTTPFYGAPYWVLVYVIRSNRYNVLKSLRPISPRWYVSSVIPLLIPSWSFWLPMTLLIFSLPTPLQFCMFCFASAAWSLVMVFVATKEAEKSGLRIES